MNNPWPEPLQKVDHRMVAGSLHCEMCGSRFTRSHLAMRAFGYAVALRQEELSRKDLRLSGCCGLQEYSIKHGDACPLWTLYPYTNSFAACSISLSRNIGHTPNALVIRAWYLMNAGRDALLWWHSLYQTKDASFSFSSCIARKKEALLVYFVTSDFLSFFLFLPFFCWFVCKLVASPVLPPLLLLPRCPSPSSSASSATRLWRLPPKRRLARTSRLAE